MVTHILLTSVSVQISVSLLLLCLVIDRKVLKIKTICGHLYVNLQHSYKVCACVSLSVPFFQRGERKKKGGGGRKEAPFLFIVWICRDWFCICVSICIVSFFISPVLNNTLTQNSFTLMVHLFLCHPQETWYMFKEMVCGHVVIGCAQTWSMQYSMWMFLSV